MMLRFLTLLLSGCLATALTPARGYCQTIPLIDLGTLGGNFNEAFGINDAGQVVGYSDTSSVGSPHAFLWQNGGMTDLGTLGGPFSLASAINAAGQVVGISLTANEVQHAFLITPEDTNGDGKPDRWVRDSDGNGANDLMTNLGTPAGPFTHVSGINDAGQVVGSSGTNSGAQHAFLITPEDTNGDGKPDRWVRDSDGNGINDLLIDLGTLGGGISLASAINAAGQVVGTSGNFVFESHAFLWQNGGMTDLGTFDGAFSAASGINDEGQVVGISFTLGGARHAFVITPEDTNGDGKPDRWVRDSDGNGINDLMTDLGTLGGVETEPRQVNDAGQVVGSSFTPGGTRHAFVITPEDTNGDGRPDRWVRDSDGNGINDLMTDLGTLGGDESFGNAINAAGHVVGFSFTASGDHHGFLAALPRAARPAVLFLHGSAASFLFQGPDGTRVWPALNDAELDLLGRMSFTGEVGADVYPKERGIINEFKPPVVPFEIIELKVYRPFSDFMDGKKSQKEINDWYPYAYDWRQDWRRIVDMGTIYSASCFEPLGEFFIPNCNLCGVCLNLQDKIVELATSQGPVLLGAPQPPPRKVWIVAHSNGGLVAKTLLQTLPQDLLDKIGGLILVASPQLGTPKSLSTLLHGKEFRYWVARFSTLRFQVKELPAAYQLLPNQRYFDIVTDPVLEFRVTGGRVPLIDLWISLYGDKVSDFATMRDFLLGKRGRPAPHDLNVARPSVLSEPVFKQSEEAHANIANFDPNHFPFPIYQIVGWGLPTIRALQYYVSNASNLNEDSVSHKTRDTCDGDETVVVPSASALEGATTYFVNLRRHNRERSPNAEHGTILNVENVQELISRIIQGKPSTDGLTYISNSKPTTDCKGAFLRLRSPAEIHLQQDGLHTGPINVPGAQPGYFFSDATIPNSQYRSLGEGRAAFVDDVGTYDVLVEGTATGTVTLEGGRFVSDSAEEVFEVPGIPILKGSRIEFTFDPTAASPPPMTIDVDGDGTPDLSLSPGAPPGPEVFLQVLSSALDKLGTATAAADLPGATLRALQKEFLEEAHEALADASEDLPGKPRRIVAKLEQARKALHGYIKRLEREVARGRVGEAVAQPLMDSAAAIVSLLEIAQDRLVPPLGHMEGEGRVHAGGLWYDFDFEVREMGKGKEEGHLTLKVRTPQPGRDHDDDDDRDDGRRRSDRFETTRIQEAVFADDPDLMPGGDRTKLDTVLIRGEGRWNGRRGFSFEATATDAGEPGAARDRFAITIRDPAGVVVATVSGLLTKGNNQAKRPSSIVGHLRD